MRCCQLAQAEIRGEGIWGTVKFCPVKDGVMVTADVHGLEDGFYALHIHMGRDCGGDRFADSMGHYDPGGTEHPFHAGDLPPLLFTNGRAFLTVITGRFRIPDIVGRTVIIHSDPDDFHTQPSGNAGTKIACGVIRRC